MLKTNSREVIAAIWGAIIGFVGPIALHFYVAPNYYPAAFGIPIAAFCLPGLFLCAIVGVALARKMGE